MRSFLATLIATALACQSCELAPGPMLGQGDDEVAVTRFDRIQTLYLTTGDFAALQQMSIGYPRQTRVLIEDVLRIGSVYDPEINSKFLNYYQDSTLQNHIFAVEHEFVNMDDVNAELRRGFRSLRAMLPGLDVPEIYAQVGSLDQSVVVGDGLLGISLDKYLGPQNPVYQSPRYGYTADQLAQMDRRYIAADCLGFYLLSLYPMPDGRQVTQAQRDLHIAKIQWVVNRALEREVFDTPGTRAVARYMKRHQRMTVHQLLGQPEGVIDIATPGARVKS